MTVPELRRFASKKCKELENQWKEEVDKNDRETAMDYIRIGNIEGQRSAYMQMLVMLTGVTP